MAKNILTQKICTLILSLGAILLISIFLDKFLGSDPASSGSLTSSQTSEFPALKVVSPTYGQMDLSEMMDLAEQGDMYAQFLIAKKYYVGEDLPIDHKMALEFFLLAGEQGEVNSQFTAAYMYQAGEGVNVDMQKAYEWYLRAADQDDAYSQYMLGQLFSSNDGYRLDYEEAFKWFKVASDVVGLATFRFVQIVHRQVQSVESDDDLHDSVPQIKPSMYTVMYTLER